MSNNKTQLSFKENDKIMLVVSSLLFLIPAYYAIICDLYTHGIFSILASFVSIIYWISPGPSWRQTLDLTISKLYIIYFVVIGIYCYNSLFQWQILLKILLIYITLMNYIMSHISWEYKLEQWIYFHISFQIWSCILQLNTIYFINENKFYL